VVSKRILQETGGAGIGGLVVNSGCANAVTGEGGMKDAESMAGSVEGGNALVMSTGVIGQRLPIDKIMKGIPIAVEKVGTTHQHWLDAATAFCTTDTFPKLLSREIQTDAGSYRIAGIAKGAGMIHPKYTPSGTMANLVWQHFYLRFLRMRLYPLYCLKKFFRTL
jgi:glutamate N-acetyltransferase/amino-acid N-acetyltransferase